MTGNGILDGVIGMAALGWLSWLSLTLLRHRDRLGQIGSRCEERGRRLSAGDTALRELTGAIGRIERNIIRLGSKAGIEEELERPDP